MASPNPLKIVEVCQIPPTSHSSSSGNDFSLPLTFFDLLWLKFPPIERLYFYELPDPSPTFFHSAIIPKLKKALSITLVHFLPLAGSLKWPETSAKPIILYTRGDGLSITVAESTADFDRLSGEEVCDATDLLPYIPQLSISENAASVLAFQVTLFPNKGFSIGYSFHHAVLDGKSITMFMKAWSYFCNHGASEEYSSLLPKELAPCLDRTVIKETLGIEALYIDHWASMTEKENGNNPRSLKLLPEIGGRSPKLVRCTFHLTRQDTNILKEKALSQTNHPIPNLSTFVLTYAHTLVSMVRALQADVNRKILFGFAVDCRGRLEPPVPSNYFGNCLRACGTHLLAKELMEEDALSMVAKRISELIKALEEGVLVGVDAKPFRIEDVKESIQVVGVAGSPRFEVYGMDFGWGRPKKVEITSIARTGAISVQQSRDGDGLEVGLVLSRQEMEVFASLFIDGLK